MTSMERTETLTKAEQKLKELEDEAKIEFISNSEV